MSYTHLTTTERVKRETYLELGMSIRSIARRLGRPLSTVSREVKRNPGYESGRAQQRYAKKKANCGAKTKLDEATRRTITEKLWATWSPEQIVGRLFDGEIAFSTIYRWIYSGRIDVPTSVLRQKCKRQKLVETRGAIQCRIVHRQAPERGACTQDIRSLGARHRGLRTWEVKGMRRDVRRTEELVLHRPSDDGP